MLVSDVDKKLSKHNPWQLTEEECAVMNAYLSSKSDPERARQLRCCVDEYRRHLRSSRRKMRRSIQDVRLWVDWYVFCNASVKLERDPKSGQQVAALLRPSTMTPVSV